MQYRFSGFIFDTDQMELSRAGRLIKLRPKVFDLLHYLLEHRHRVVPKDELFEVVWSRKYVSEATLNSCLKELRKALDDSGHDQLIIRTFHGRGYRFMQEVEEAGVESGVPQRQAADEEDRGEASAAQQVFGADQEYKSASAVVCGITDAGKTSDRLGPEAFHRFMRDFLTVARGCVERFDGTIIRWNEDGFVALFGAPRAFEDHARRAVLATLDVHDRFARLPAGGGAPSQLQSGIHTGALVVDSTEGIDEPLYTSVGGTLETASLLRTTARPGEILASAATFDIVHTEFIAERRHRDGQEPHVYAITNVVRQRAGVPQRPFLSCFVGRGQEIDILVQRRDQTIGGRGQLIAITGEPGIGKSRLVTEITDRFRQSGSIVLTGHCLPYATATPYSALLDLVRDRCGIDVTDVAAAVSGKLAAALRDVGACSDQATALLMELLGFDADTASLSGLSSQARRSETFSLLRRLLLTSEGSLVLVIEDLHWVDATTEDWLKELVARLGGLALLLVVTYRSDYQPSWLTHSSFTRLSMPPLSPTDAESLIKSIPRRPLLSSRMASHVIDKARGNPFFLEELTWAFAGTEGQVPDTVQAVLADRIDRLAPEVKNVLQVAAVIGEPVYLKLLSSICAQEQTVVEAAIAELQTKEFVYEHEGSPERSIRFKHALTQEVAYHSLLSSVREQLHGKIFSLLEDEYPEYADQRPDVLAQHATAARQTEQAVSYWERAGRRAHARSANIEAIGHLTKGLEILKSRRESMHRTQQELKLLTALSPALMAAKGYAAPEVEQTCARARYLCERIGEAEQLFPILVGLWNYYWVRGQSETACETGWLLLKLAEEDENPKHLTRAHIALGEILFHTGQLTEACSHLDRAIELAESHHRSGGRMHVSRVGCLCYAAWSHWYLGSVERSSVLAREALNLADALQDPLSQSVGLCLIAELHQVRGEPKQAKALAEQGVAVARKQGFPFWEGTGLILGGWASAMTGSGDTAIEQMRRGLKVFRSTGADVQQTAWLGLLAEAYLHEGFIDAALASIEEAFQWIDTIGERYNEAELHRLKAECLRRSPDRDNPAGVEACYQHAIEVARRQKAASLEQRASSALAEYRDEAVPRLNSRR